MRVPVFCYPAIPRSSAANLETAANRRSAGRNQRPDRSLAKNPAPHSPRRSAGKSSSAKRRWSGPTLSARARTRSEIAVPIAKATASVALISCPSRFWQIRARAVPRSRRRCPFPETIPPVTRVRLLKSIGGDVLVRSLPPPDVPQDLLSKPERRRRSGRACRRRGPSLLRARRAKAGWWPSSLL